MSSITDKPAKGIWSGSNETPEESTCCRPAGEVGTKERKAIERWENEGGEILKEQLSAERTH